MTFGILSIFVGREFPKKGGGSLVTVELFFGKFNQICVFTMPKFARAYN